MALEFDLAGSQIDGARDYQEDAFLITHLTDANGAPSALVVIADGMGGHAAGNVASNMAVQAFNKHVSTNYPSDNISEVLENAVVKANNSIKETVTETPALSGMGCTMVAAILEEGNMWWVSVGDSHCYLVRDRELIKKNADHSYGGFLDRMEAEGTPVDAEPGLSRNMLMSAVTGEDINEIDVPANPFELQAGDKVLLCSDGLDTLSAGKIIQYSDWSDAPKECADALMQAVEEANMPRQDNTTAVVVTVKDSTTATPAVEEEPITEDTDALEATSEFSVDEIEAENAAAAAEASTAEASTVEDPIKLEPISEEAAAAQQKSEPFKESKSKTGLMIGIAAAIVILIGAGAFFTMGGDKSAQQSEPMVADVELEMEEEVEPTTEAIEEEEDDEATETETETVTEKVVAEEKPVVAAVETKPEATEPKTTSGKTIQDSLKSGGKAPAMVVIAAGKFNMGSTSSKNSNERPRHEVSVEQFAVSKNEITFAEYDAFAKATGRKVPDSLYMDRATAPVIFVSWDDAYYYTKWLSEETGEKYRLLSEAEWEYMASTGKKSPFWWGYKEEPNRAHCFGCGTGLDPRKPTKVGSFGANAFGVHDSAGNVSEWVHDCWHPNYKGAPTDAEVWEGGDCSYRSVRGGAYSTPPQSIQNQKRDKFKSDKAYDHIGIRVARKIR
jgi:formylglycine-generating enzyme required for sulfatase activity/serine/threonine protein phosphatase PrpC